MNKFIEGSVTVFQKLIEGGIRGLYRGVGMHLNLLVFGTVNSAAVLYFTAVLLL